MPGGSLRKLVIPALVVLSAGVFGRGCAPSGSSKDVLSLIGEYQAKKAAFDIEGALALLAEDCVIVKSEHIRLEGKTAVRAYFEYEAGLGTVLAMSNCVGVPGREFEEASCSGRETNAFQKAAGLPEYLYPSIVFSVSKGRIRSIVVQRSPETSRAVEDFNFFFQGWLTAVHPEELETLLGEDGKIRYGRETAARLARLAEIYKSQLIEIK